MKYSLYNQWNMIRNGSDEKERWKDEREFLGCIRDEDAVDRLNTPSIRLFRSNPQDWIKPTKVRLG